MSRKSFEGDWALRLGREDLRFGVSSQGKRNFCRYQELSNTGNREVEEGGYGRCGQEVRRREQKGDRRDTNEEMEEVLKRVYRGKVTPKRINCLSCYGLISSSIGWIKYMFIRLGL